MTFVAITWSKEARCSLMTCALPFSAIHLRLAALTTAWAWAEAGMSLWALNYLAASFANLRFLLGQSELVRMAGQKRIEGVAGLSGDRGCEDSGKGNRRAVEERFGIGRTERARALRRRGAFAAIGLRQPEHAEEQREQADG